MKRTYIITLLLSLCSLFTYAQESFFDKYADMEGVTSVYISKAMLSLMPDMKTEEIYIGELASKLDNIQILNCEKSICHCTDKERYQLHQSQERLSRADTY